MGKSIQEEEEKKSVFSCLPAPAFRDSSTIIKCEWLWYKIRHRCVNGILSAFKAATHFLVRRHTEQRLLEPPDDQVIRKRPLKATGICFLMRRRGCTLCTNYVIKNLKLLFSEAKLRWNTFNYTGQAGFSSSWPRKKITRIHNNSKKKNWWIQNSHFPLYKGSWS